MVYPKTCEYKGWMKESGGNCFRSQYSINSPRKRCDGPAGCVWRSQRSRSLKKSQPRGGSRSPPRCVWGKRSIYDDRVGTCYNRDAVRFDNTGWRKCNYPSNCVGRKRYDKSIYTKNDSDDKDDSTESSLQRKITCEKQYILNFIKLDKIERDAVTKILNGLESIQKDKWKNFIKEILENDIYDIHFKKIKEQKNIFLYKTLKKLDVENILSKKIKCADKEIESDMQFLHQLSVKNLSLINPDDITKIKKGSL